MELCCIALFMSSKADVQVIIPQSKQNELAASARRPFEVLIERYLCFSSSLVLLDDESACAATVTPTMNDTVFSSLHSRMIRQSLLSWISFPYTSCNVPLTIDQSNDRWKSMMLPAKSNVGVLA